MEQAIDILISACEECDRLRAELAPKLDRMSKLFNNVKDEYAARKLIIKNNYPKEKATTTTEGIMGKLFYTDFTLTFEPFDTMPATFDFKEGDGEGAFVIRNITIGK